MKLILIGAPGSGKRTQAKYLTEKYHIPLIATGGLGRQAKTIADAGQTVPNDLIIGMIRERIARPDADQGFVLDGFPRNVVQAISLDDILDKLGKPIDAVLQFDVDAEMLIQRMIGRLNCISCGALFNLFTQPPAIDDKCDECGSILHHRADDNEEIIERRLTVFETLTQHGDVTEVTKRVKSALRGLRPKRTPVKPMLPPAATPDKNTKPKVKHVKVETRQPKLRPRKVIKPISGNTRIKKLNIKKELPVVVSKKTIKAAAKKKLDDSKAAADAKALEVKLDKQLKDLEKELKQTKVQLKKASVAEKALLKAEKAKDATLKKTLHAETAKLKKKKKK
jgi:adenylate kinase